MTISKVVPGYGQYRILSSPRRIPFDSGVVSFISPVLRIRIRICRIRMFLSLLDPDPDPLVRGMDPDPDLDPSNIKQK